MKLLTMKKTPLWAVSTTLVLALLQGCASGPNAIAADPLEPLNRAVFGFNDGLDRSVVKPVATVYRDVTPAPVRTGVHNFFANVGDLWSSANNALQFKPEAATDSLFRFTVNTLWGLGGLIDVATEMKIPKHRETFGSTLAHWGVGMGPYLVLPVLGPSSVRGSVGLVVDFQGNLVSRHDDIPVRNSLTTLNLVDQRSNFLGAGTLLEEAALDKYTFARDIYFQQQRRPARPGAAAEPEERFDLPEAPAGAALPAAK